MTVLECKGLSKQYGRTLALDDVSFSLEGGRIVGLLGPNGSGKTTFIKLCNGLLSPGSGELRICGKLPGKESKALVSFLPDRPYLPGWMNVRQALDMFEDFYDDFHRERALEMLAHLNISENQGIHQMSKGTKEKVQLILVMSRSARLYLLDEPIGGVDPATRDYILKTIITNYEPESTVLISTHLIADVEQALDYVIFIDHGKIVLQSDTDSIRLEKGKSVDALFREVFKCSEN